MHFFHRYAAAVSLDNSQRDSTEEIWWEPKASQQRKLAQLFFQRLYADWTGSARRSCSGTPTDSGEGDSSSASRRGRLWRKLVEELFTKILLKSLKRGTEHPLQPTCGWRFYLERAKPSCRQDDHDYFRGHSGIRTRFDSRADWGRSRRRKKTRSTFWSTQKDESGATKPRLPTHQGRKIRFRGRQNLQHPPRHPLSSPRPRCLKAQQIENWVLNTTSSATLASSSPKA
jgi:hypothetical protein